MGIFNKGGQLTVRGSFFKKVPEEVFCSETFYNCYKKLIQTPNYHYLSEMLIYWGLCYKNTAVNYHGNFNPTFSRVKITH
jgi:hypothetical protein